MAGTGRSSVRSYSMFSTGAVTANFADTKIDFIDLRDGTQFLSQGLLFISDGTGDFEFSYDGTTVDGRINEGDMISFDFKRERRVYLRGVAAGTPTYRFWAW